MKYKNTLNLPRTEFPMRANLAKNEDKYRNLWSKNEIFRKLTDRDGDLFILHDGPPYANGNIHVGHALNKILKDFILRWAAFRGKRIHYVPGWDTHGLPIENRVEKDGDYKFISTSEKRRRCREYALGQLELQKTQFLKLHLLSDFKNYYTTLDPAHVTFELQLFVDFLSKGLLKREFLPVAWSWSSGTALAESEIIYREVETESIYVWFPLKSGVTLPDGTILEIGTRFLIWTTTPYTLEGNLAISVNPEFIYGLVEDGNGNRYLCLESLLDEVGLVNTITIGTIEGRNLLGLEYLNPLTGEIGKIIGGDHVMDDQGTGLVHTAPGYGLEDYVACTHEGIGVYVSIGKDGHFYGNTKFSPVNGMFYMKAARVIADWLEEKGHLVSRKIIRHSLGHDWRSEKPLLYLASPQWFLDLGRLRGDLEESFRGEVWSSPEWLVNQLRSTVLKRDRWCLSRQRSWGIPIPVLYDEEDRPILDARQMKHILEIMEREGYDVWFKENAEYFLCPDLEAEYVGRKLRKSEDVLDVWFDSGCSWRVIGQKKADVYLEGFDQIRGWFNSSAIVGTACGRGLPFGGVIGHGFVLDGEGNKMSKSRGNVVDPLELVEEYGTDILRLFVALNDYREDIRISRESMDQTVSVYRKIRNTIFKYSLSVLPEGFRPRKRGFRFEENVYIRWLFWRTWRKIEEGLGSYLFASALKEMLGFMNVYSGWYLEICKDVLYCGLRDSEEYLETLDIIGMVFERCLRLFGIFIPQTVEEAWGYYSGEEGTFALEKWIGEEENVVEVDLQKWERFFELKDEVNVMVEELKNRGEISGSVEAGVEIPRTRMMDLNLVKLLNVCEVREGDILRVYAFGKVKCERCRRYPVESGDLCCRCGEVISGLGG